MVAIVAAAVGHLLAWWRESGTAKAGRKRNFLGLMDGMRLEAERIRETDYVSIFPTRLYEVRKEGAKIKGDLSEATLKAFNSAIEALCQLRDNEISKESPDHPGRTKVTEAIDAVTASLN